MKPFIRVFYGLSLYDANHHPYLAGLAMLFADQLKQIAPHSTDTLRARYLPALNAAFDTFQINTPRRIAAFLANVVHESGSFQYSEEIYSGRSYEDRADLGNHQPGDGMRFKGRGLIQVTGRANYAACGKALGLDLLNRPELLEQPQAAVDSAAWFWDTHNCNALADVDQFTNLRRRINGGLNGLAECKAIYRTALGVLAP